MLNSVFLFIGDLAKAVHKQGLVFGLLSHRASSGRDHFRTRKKILQKIGQWLAINGEAVYGTRSWNVFGEGPTEVPEGSFKDTQRSEFTAQDFRFTKK